MDPVQKNERHSKYYASDSLVFLVDNKLFGISGDLLRQGQHFRDMLDNPDIGGAEQGKTDDDPIVLDSKLGVSASDLESFLEVLTSGLWKGKLSKTWDSWAQALKLAAMWSFTDIKGFIVKEMETAPEARTVAAFEWLHLADQSNVPPWLQKGFGPLCTRKELLSLKEAKKLGTRRLLALSRLRERFRDPHTHCGLCNYCGSRAVSERTVTHYFSLEPDLLIIGI